jgi:hypothetical protein
MARVAGREVLHHRARRQGLDHKEAGRYSGSRTTGSAIGAGTGHAALLDSAAQPGARCVQPDSQLLPHR